MASRNRRPLGLQRVVLSDNTTDNTTIDIIAIHGLDTGSPRTWEYRKNGSSAVNWISDSEMLPALVPEARIYTYEWNANCFQDAPVQTMFGHADNFLACVAGERASQSRPIIFVASCFGGLILAEAICRAAQEGSPYRHILLSTVGAVFLATPFGGSDAASQAQWLVTVKGIMGEQSSDQLVRDLKEKHDFVRQRVQKFAEIANADSVRLPVRCFFETKKTKLLRKLLSRSFAAKLSSSSTNKILVTESSACLHGFPRQGLDAAHSGMNKFGGPEDLNFKLVGGSIENLVQNASSVWKHRQAGKLAVVVPSHGNVHWRVPRGTTTIFTGRDELLQRIKRAIRSDPNSSPCLKQKRFAITGLGGQGKSEICLQVASQMREEFWGVFWVDVDKVSTAESDFIAIAKLLGHSVEGVSNALQVLANIKQTWLLVLDNADDPDFDYHSYFPSGTHGAVLITSRVPECKMYSPEQFEALEGLGNEDSKELLLKAANIPKESWRSYNDQAETVVQLLGSHTLALIQAGAYIAKGHCRLHDYPKTYKRQRKRLMEFRPKQAQSRYCDVYATFQVSAEVLERSGSQAAKDALELLAILSNLNSAVLPLQFFQNAWNGRRAVLRTTWEGKDEMYCLSQRHALRMPGFLVAKATGEEISADEESQNSAEEESEESEESDDEEWEEPEEEEWDSSRLIEASSQLISLSLVTRHGVDGLEGLSMHPLAHAWAKDRQDSTQKGGSWITAGCFLALSRGNYEARHTHERYILTHIQSYLDINIRSVVFSEDQSIVIPILVQCGWILLRLRQDIRLSYLLEEMFTILGKNPEEPSEDSLPLYSLQARSLYNLGKYKKAMVLFQKVVNIKKVTLAKDDPSLIFSQHDLACAYRENGQVKEALELFEYTSKIVETKLPEDDPDRLRSQYQLACAYLANRQIKEARTLLEHVVNVREALAEEHPDRLTSQHLLAYVYLEIGQIKEAIILLEHVVNTEESLAEDHPDRLTSQNELAYAYKVNGQMKEAVTLLEHIVRIQGLKYETGHPQRVASENFLACCLEQIRS